MKYYTRRRESKFIILYFYTYTFGFLHVSLPIFSSTSDTARYAFLHSKNVPPA